MAINFSRQVYMPGFDVFARTVSFTPLIGSPFTGRGVYSTQPEDVMAEDASIFSDHRTILDIIEVEYPVLPAQGDVVLIDSFTDLPAVGSFEVIDTTSNGGGEMTLTLRRVMVTKP